MFLLPKFYDTGTFSKVLNLVPLLLHYSPNIYFLVHALVKNKLFPLSPNKEDTWKN